MRFGTYEIIERLGEGGMCFVFRARRDGDPQDCALKLLKENRRKDERFRDLFITEADLSLLLDHPNLVRTFDAGEVDGRYYIAMELIEGGSMAQLLDRCKKLNIELPIDYGLYIISEILEGLHSLHFASGRTGRPLNLIHRDITPQNIFLCFDGRVILGDFGVAQIGAYGAVDPREMLGKIGYLAPEMILQEEVDLRADIFATGIVLYEVLTGTRLFHSASDEDLMEEIVDARITRPSKLRPMSKVLETVVLRALAHRPRDRFQTAEEMIYDLESHWSKEIGNPYAMAALLAAVYREEVDAWRKVHPQSGFQPPL